MTTLSLFYEGKLIGNSDNVSLEINRGNPIDISSHGDPFSQFISGVPTWTLRAQHVTFRDNFESWATTPNPTLARIEEDGRSVMEGMVFAESVEEEHHSIALRPSYNIIFRGQGALVKTDRFIDRTPLDSWHLPNINDRSDAIGFAMSKAENLMRQEVEKQLFSPVLIHKGNVNINNTTTTGTKKRTKKSDREDSDETPRGFRIVP